MACPDFLVRIWTLWQVLINALLLIAIGSYSSLLIQKVPGLIISVRQVFGTVSQNCADSSELIPAGKGKRQEKDVIVKDTMEENLNTKLWILVWLGLVPHPLGSGVKGLFNSWQTLEELIRPWVSGLDHEWNRDEFMLQQYYGGMVGPYLEGRYPWLWQCPWCSVMSQTTPCLSVIPGGPKVSSSAPALQRQT